MLEPVQEKLMAETPVTLSACLELEETHRYQNNSNIEK